MVHGSDMTLRAQQFMDEVWHERNTWADTETKLVAAIIRNSLPHAKTYTASTLNNLEVIDKNDLITLSVELEKL
jgi:hypothetical protein